LPEQRNGGAYDEGDAQGHQVGPAEDRTEDEDEADDGERPGQRPGGSPRGGGVVQRRLADAGG
jgi:hypothetical protein